MLADRKLPWLLFQDDGLIRVDTRGLSIEHGNDRARHAQALLADPFVQAWYRASGLESAAAVTRARERLKVLGAHHVELQPPNHRRGLCGVENPIFDLNPVDGVIDCPACLELWAAGYRGPHTKGWPVTRFWLVKAVGHLRGAIASGRL